MTVAWYERAWYGGTAAAREVRLDPQGAVAHLPGRGCVWREHGVWGVKGGVPVLLRPDYFARDATGQPVDYLRDCWLPFVRRFAAGLREAHPQACGGPTSTPGPYMHTGTQTDTSRVRDWTGTHSVVDAHMRATVTTHCGARGGPPSVSSCRHPRGHPAKMLVGRVRLTAVAAARVQAIIFVEPEVNAAPPHFPGQSRGPVPPPLDRHTKALPAAPAPARALAQPAAEEASASPASSADTHSASPSPLSAPTTAPVPYAAAAALAASVSSPGPATVLPSTLEGAPVAEVDHAQDEPIPGPLVYAPHWYDGLTLFNKRFHSWNVNLLGMMRGHVSTLDAVHVGEASVYDAYEGRGVWRLEPQALANRMPLFPPCLCASMAGAVLLSRLRSSNEKAWSVLVRIVFLSLSLSLSLRSLWLADRDGGVLGRYPCLIGETGIPFDLEGGAAYRTHDYRDQVRRAAAVAPAQHQGSQPVLLHIACVPVGLSACLCLCISTRLPVCVCLLACISLSLSLSVAVALAGAGAAGDPAGDGAESGGLYVVELQSRQYQRARRPLVRPAMKCVHVCMSVSVCLSPSLCQG
jgi:hypothetical protein